MVDQCIPSDTNGKLTPRRKNPSYQRSPLNRGGGGLWESDHIEVP